MARTAEQRFWSKVEKQEDGCWRWKGYIGPNGYGQFHMKGKDGKVKIWYAHRAAWFLTHGRIPRKPLLHSCNDTACVCLSHLRIGTHKANTADMLAAGREAHSGSVQAIGATLTPAKHLEYVRQSYQKNREKRLAKSRAEYRSRVESKIFRAEHTA